MKPACQSKVPCPAEHSGYESVRGTRVFLLRVVVFSMILGLMFQAVTMMAQSQLRWADSKGVVLRDGNREVCWGWNVAGDSMRIGFPAANIVQRLLEPGLNRSEGQQLLLTYDTESPDGVPLKIERRVEAKAGPDGLVL